jgi:large subunit ribosomal protein L30
MAKKAAAAEKKTVVVLRRSPIGEKPKVRATVEGLGLRKLHQSKELPDNDSVRGMIHKVRHLVEVKEVELPKKEEAPKKAAATRKKTS